jgi:hypothetical protein
LLKNITWNCRVYSEFKKCLTLLCITHWKFRVSVWLFEKKRGPKLMRFPWWHSRAAEVIKIGWDKLFITATSYPLISAKLFWQKENNKSQESETCAASTFPLIHKISWCILFIVLFIRKKKCGCQFNFFEIHKTTHKKAQPKLFRRPWPFV